MDQQSKLKNKGLYDQMQDPKTNLECYNNLTLEKLTEFVTQIADSLDFSKIVYPELTEEQVKGYIKFIKHIKKGYLYQIGDSDKDSKQGRKFILTTGSEGCRDFIKTCIKDNIPPELVIPNIWIIDDEENIMVRLMYVKWTKKIN